ncbi:MAG: hypothetical protein ACI9QV_000923 [Methylophagaceae bacterium]|jgi:hypothetical protein
MLFHTPSLAITFALLLSACSSAHRTQQKNNIENTQHNVAYNILVKTIKAMPSLEVTVDLRAVYVLTDRYQSNTHEKELNQSLINAMASANWPNCVRKADEVLELNYTNLNAHYAAIACHFELDEKKRGQYHEDILNLLLEAIWTTGDGESAKTAFHITSKTEKEAFIKFHGLHVVKQTVIDFDDQDYDLMTLDDAQNNDVFEWYFIQNR